MSFQSNDPLSQQANSYFWQWVFFTWASPLMKIGADREDNNEQMLVDDLLIVPNSEQPQILREKFKTFWDDEHIRVEEENAKNDGKKLRPSLWNAFLRFQKRNLVLGAIGVVVSELCVLATPYLFAEFIKYLFDPLRPASEGWPYIVGIFLLMFVGPLNDILSFFFTESALQQMRSVLSMLVFDTTLKYDEVHATERAGNLIAAHNSDTKEFMELASFFQYLWSFPLILIGQIISICVFIGPVGLLSLLIVVATIPIQAVLIMSAFGYKAKFVDLTDKRMSLIAEMLSAIRICKFMAWEDDFERRIGKVRHDETNLLRPARVLMASVLSVSAMTTYALHLSLGVLIYADNAPKYLEPFAIFPAVAIMAKLGGGLLFFAVGAGRLNESLLALERVENSIMGRERVEYVIREFDDTNNKENLAAEMKNVSVVATIPSASEENDDAENNQHNNDKGTEIIAKNLSLKIHKGKLTIILGKLGSGKSLLCRALIGEAVVDVEEKFRSTGNENDKGYVKHFCPAALVSQEKYIMNATVRENITMNFEYKTTTAITTSKNNEPDAFDVKGFSTSATYLNPENDRSKYFNNSNTNENTANVSVTENPATLISSVLNSPILFQQQQSLKIVDERRYQETLRVCQLIPDLQEFPFGDLTEVGSSGQGITISGGQAQRLSIARAVYSTRELIIIDDALSALDPHVAHAIFDECVCGMLKGKTVVLVTHMSQFVSRADRVVLMSGCQIVFDGTVDEYKQRGFHVEELGTNDDDNNNNEEDDDDNDNNGVEETDKGQQAIQNEPNANQDHQDHHRDDPQRDAAGGGSQLMTNEDRLTGSVSLATYKWYLVSGGVATFLLGVLSNGAAQMFYAAEYLFLASWVTYRAKLALPPNVTLTDSDDITSKMSAFVTPRWNDNSYLTAMGICVLAGTICGILRNVFLGYFYASASRSAHESLLRSTLRAPIDFFNSTPSGRIINRFCADVLSLDVNLADKILLVINTSGALAGAIAIMIVSSSWLAILVVVFIVYFSLVFASFAKAARGVKRLQLASQSLAIALMGELTVGLATIRAYSLQTVLSDKHVSKISLGYAPVYSLRCAQAFLRTRIDLISALILFFIGMFALLGRHYPDVAALQVSPGLISIALSVCYGAATALGVMTKAALDLEVEASCAERILEYAERIPQEKDLKYCDDHENNEPTASSPSSSSPLFSSIRRPPPTWARKNSSIEFRNVFMRYKPHLPYALNGVSFKIPSGCRSAICGRSGSGKSSLLLILLRMFEIERGEILVDGLDVTRGASIRDLRSRCATIPQEPTLFAGTIRSNLDPFGEHCDDDLWTVLEKIGLRHRFDTDAADDDQHGELLENNHRDHNNNTCGRPVDFNNNDDDHDADFKNNINNNNSSDMSLVLTSSATMRTKKSSDFDRNNTLNLNSLMQDHRNGSNVTVVSAGSTGSRQRKPQRVGDANEKAMLHHLQHENLSNRNRLLNGSAGVSPSPQDISIGLNTLFRMNAAPRNQTKKSNSSATPSRREPTHSLSPGHCSVGGESPPLAFLQTMHRDDNNTNNNNINILLPHNDENVVQVPPISNFGNERNENIRLSEGDQELSLTQQQQQQQQPHGLDYVVAVGGSNLSCGERQLLCLARALLKKDQIGTLLLDEITSSVDVGTDRLIQRLIRAEFKDCTIVTIAHRISTIIDCDQVIVMQRGVVAEIGHPAELLKNSESSDAGIHEFPMNQGLFRSMAQKLGPEQFEKLRAVAEGRTTFDAI